MRHVGHKLTVIVVAGAFNAAGDIGPAIVFFSFLICIRENDWSHARI